MAFQCQVSNKVDSDTIGFKAAVVTVALSAASGFAMLKDPAGGKPRYAAALAYGLGGGAYAGAQVGVKLPQVAGRWSTEFTRGVEASVVGGARVGFIYESPDEGAMRAVLDRTWPPAGWNRMTVELGATVAGTGEIGVGVLAGLRVGGEVSTAAELTVYPGSGMSVARAWRGTIAAGSGGNGPSLLGLKGGWEGTLAVSYVLRFDADTVPRQLSVVTETRAGDELVQTTRILDLRVRRNAALLERAWPDLLVNPFPAVAHGAGIFLTSAAESLWRRMETAGTKVRAVYALTSQEQEYALAYSLFGGSLQTGTLDSRLRSIAITRAGVEVPQKCVAVPAPSRPPLQHPAELLILPPACLPPTDPTPAPSPSGPPTADATPEATATDPGAATDPGTTAGPDTTPDPGATPGPDVTPTGDVTPDPATGAGCGQVTSPSPPESPTPTGTLTPTDTPTDTPTPTPATTDTPAPSPTTAGTSTPSTGATDEPTVSSPPPSSG
ncbi:hypothetical protein [Sphaerisporangium aureirubrum]|uniref:Uncharacterized protein n=1 Tax=Sphaerisporangium aureirubrum TaxID=1544736 RepID=A0ABW1NJ69_9ACTN